MAFNSHKWIKSFKRSRAVSRQPIIEILKIAGKEVKTIDKEGDDPEKWSIIYTDGSSEPYLKHIREDDNIFSADDEQPWPSGPFGKKDDYADEAGSSYKRSKDWQIDKPGEDIPTKGTGYKA